MPISIIEDSAALVVIDLQNAIVKLPCVHPINAVIARAAQLAQEFRKRAMPVVLVHVAGVAPGRSDHGPSRFQVTPEGLEFVPELTKDGKDWVVTKERWGAFLGTDLHDRLQKQGITQIVLVGVATSIGVESTARSAYDLGYHVVLAVDAMTDLNLDAHQNSIERIFPRLGETGTTDDVLNLLGEQN